ncbi:hypothetical protein RB619_09515 [Flavobacterium sp. LHD-80]|uniref:hypothetical protein n=1 Tax=Flavobacterium sp. LHD-80 TaxID=3071411 RepID=UPI0027E1F054|nr:hypothetical protein [Flavobacterium sp. LHD-80]MDQ6470878.1 hypothetical protein [Flavobacterium sp. LHD-80]
MDNITRCNYEKAYKEAIRTKYNSEKEIGENSNYLETPSQAHLRDLCWRILRENPSPDDLKVYWDFKGVPFNKNQEDTCTTYTDKYKKVGAFLKGEKEPQKIDTVDMAAILIDFEPRPFRKFKAKAMSQEGQSTVQGAEVLPKTEYVKPVEILKQPETAVFTKTPNKKRKIRIYKSKFKMFRTVAIASVVCLIGVIIYLALPQKECMQWSGDHYEIVSCDLKTKGSLAENPVELLDESLVHLKKVDLDDKTVCFDKYGRATIWYATTADGIEFFNGHGRHPENNNALKPVTKDIFRKYAHKSSAEK